MVNLRWLFGNFMDPQYDLSLREQFRLSNEAHRRFVSTPAIVIRTAIIVAPFLAFLALLRPLLDSLGYGGDTVLFSIVIAVMIAVFWPWSAWMYRSLYVKPIRRVMRDAGYDLCIECGYDLRGLDDVSRCPECGTVRTPRGKSSAISDR